MAKSLFIAPTSMGSGLTSVCLGLLRAMERVGISVGFYKPFCQSVNQENPNTTTAKTRPSPLFALVAICSHQNRIH